MTRYKSLILLGLFAVIAFACKDGYIDGISKVDPGTDNGAPIVEINYPMEGALVQDSLEISPIVFKFTATDDIEVENVVVELDGTEIANYSTFTDYRIVKKDVDYATLEVGSHTLTVTATDLEGNTSVASVNFLRVTDLGMVAPLPNEIFYMPFDGDDVNRFAYRINNATIVGSPGFDANGWQEEAYKGAEDAYLTVPFDGLQSDEFSAAFWYKVDATLARSGILVVGNDIAENRNQGFRLFREGNETEQRIKLNVGTGEGETWNDGATIDPTAGEWVHVVFTISGSECVIYFNGEAVNTGTLANTIDWTGCNELTIGAGGETFSYWDHLSDLSLYDDLRLYNTALTPEEIKSVMADVPEVLESETLYMSFNGDYTVQNVAETVGTPSYTDESVYREAYQGATDAYLTLPVVGMLTSEFSGAFWYKVDATADRAGILTIGATTDNREQGFRLFREGNATEQRIKLNVGTGGGETWNDGGLINPTTGEWVHVAFTISGTECVIYFNGEAINTGTLANPIDWTGCSELTIAAGGETFSYWDHLSDNSIYDELRFFGKALSQAEVKAIYEAEK